MYYRVCVQPAGRIVNEGERLGLLHDAHSLGTPNLQDIRIKLLYFLCGELAPQHVDILCATLFADPVIETAQWQLVHDVPVGGPRQDGAWVVEVGLHPGVTDPVANQIVITAAMLGIPAVQAATGRRYELLGDLDEAAVHALAHRLLCNPTIQNYSLGPMSPAFPQPARASHQAHPVPLESLSDDELIALSRQRLLALNLQEMHAIRDYFKAVGRPPTDLELETLAQTWSEHCVHKTFKALIELRDGNGTITRVDGLLRSYIRAATEQVHKPWVRSAFVDNAGIIDFDDDYEVSFKVETHNHPSALEPFGGANTGVGGVVRDIIGVSARPIAVTNVLCFGPQNLPLSQVPEGSLHPRRIKAGVVAGIQDYGNKLGLPTVSGAVLYDESFTANPLVFAGCLGIAPKGSHPAGPRAGDLVVVIGGRTGRDGLHGATFSSEELTHETGRVAGTAVQIGDPIVEKDVIEVVCLARDAGLYTAITDCGAGGLSSAVGELGKRLGADVDLRDVPLKYSGLQPWEIWLSEAQERMVLAVPEDKWEALHRICHDWRVEATVIGRFTGNGRLVVRYGGYTVADLDMAFLHDGVPRMRLDAVWQTLSRPPKVAITEGPAAACDRVLLALLAHPNIASKEDIIRRYDHEVGAGTLIKPMAGICHDGPSDAVVLKPIQTWRHHKGIVLSLGINPTIGKIDPYAMAISAIDEAIRNAVAVGADPDRIAFLDNFCWGSPRRPEQVGGLVRAAQGCYDAALAYGAPFISGKDSLNNEYLGPQGERIPIPGTLLISAVAIIPDVRAAVTMDLKQAGNLLFIVGETRGDLLGSHAAAIGVASNAEPLQPPTLPDHGLERYRALHQAMQAGLVRACHDLSEGGLGVAAAEMCIGGRMGMTVRLADMPVQGQLDDVARLFAESNGRFLVEVGRDDATRFREMMSECPVAEIGVVGGETLRVFGSDGRVIVDLPVGDLVTAWRGGSS